MNNLLPGQYHIPPPPVEVNSRVEDQLVSMEDVCIY